jgi:acetyl esterase/lipase
MKNPLLLVLFLVGAPVFSADDLIVEQNIVYATHGGQELKLDLVRPKEQDGRVPGIVVIHGGGWKGGAKEHVRPFVDQFARAGYVTATVQYRLCPTHKFPCQVEDVKTAVRWMRANADKYQIDKERFGAIGFSAGGHLSLMLGLMDPKDGLEGDGYNDESSKVQAVVNYFGPTDLIRIFPQGVSPILVEFLGGPSTDKKDAYVQASPLTYIDKNDPPILTIHGTKDNIVPYSQAEILDAKLRETGVPSTVITMTDKGHGWSGADIQETQRKAIDFFNAQLKPPAAPKSKP